VTVIKNNLVYLYHNIDILKQEQIIQIKDIFIIIKNINNIIVSVPALSSIEIALICTISLQYRKYFGYLLIEHSYAIHKAYLSVLI
jgi:hypothetical protein